MSDLIDALVSFTETYPEVIPNLRAAHRPGRYGYCRACPSGTPHERCRFLTLVAAVEARKATAPPPASSPLPPPVPLAPRRGRRAARAGVRRG